MAARGRLDGCDLDGLEAASQEPGVQRIFLLDATAALGWERIRELESDSLAAMQLGIQRAIEAELYFYSKVFGFEVADEIAKVPIENLD